MKEKKVLTEDEELKKKENDKMTGTAFLLFFPTLIIAVIGALATKSVWQSAVILALVIYQFLMSKKFIEDFYKR